MKEELRESLRHMQSHPTTGTPHNQQVISTQVETIFMLDELKKQMTILNKTIRASEKQGRKLEVSNYRLQWAMLILATITTIIATYPVLLSLTKWASRYVEHLFNFGSAPLTFLSALAGFLSVVTGSLITVLGRKFYEK